MRLKVLTIGIYTEDFENEFISLTDIARYKSDDPTAVIANWMRNRRHCGISWALGVNA